MLHRFLGCFLVAAALGSGQAVVSQNHWFTSVSGNQVSSGQNSQTPNASTKRYSVSGSVVNAITGSPVSRAVVHLQGPESTQMFTGDDGRFEFKDVPEGRVSVSVQRPGFQNGRNSQQQVTVTASTQSIELKLSPQSLLKGHVLNSDGEPVEGVQVQLFRRQIVSGSREWLPNGGMATSDETGAFIMENIPPGAYLVHTGAQRVFMAAASVVVDGRHFPDLYPAQYFPNAVDRSSAQPIQIQPGTEAQVDFTLTPVPSYTASGLLTSTMRGYSASCETQEGEVVSNAFRLDSRTGQFTLLQLPPGECTLRLSNRSRGGDGAYGEIPISIGASDITGLRLAVEPLSDIPVIISGNSSSNNTANNNQGTPGVNIELIPLHSRNDRSFANSSRKGEEQVLTSVMPGIYRVVAHVFGGGCLAAITSGSIDLLRNNLTVSAGGSAAPINVTLRTDCGSISGKVDGSTSNDLVGVIALPEGAPSQAVSQMMVGSNIQLTNLTPGDYTIYAVTHFFAYEDPEVLKTVQGQKVTVAPNGQMTLQLPLINTSEEMQ